MGAPGSAKEFEERLGRDLLKNVSRSFYLTLRLLPGELRGTVSLAYLLARASDSIADAVGTPARERLELLEGMGKLLEGWVADESPVEIAEAAVAGLEDEGEKALLAELPACFEWLGVVEEHEAAAVRGVLKHILRGQRLDVERFPDEEEVRGLAKAEELEEYTYLVAGSVGEFWTELAAEVLGEKTFEEEVKLMSERGKALGKGLQLINILRDLPGDLEEGRCYLPAEELGICAKLEELREKVPKRLDGAFEEWSERCGKWLEEGVEYVEATRHKRLRYGTALPLLLAVRTKALFDAASWEERAEGVKVSRGEVKKIMARAGVAVLKKDGVRKLYAELGQ